LRTPGAIARAEAAFERILANFLAAPAQGAAS